MTIHPATQEKLQEALWAVRELENLLDSLKIDVLELSEASPSEKAKVRQKLNKIRSLAHQSKEKSDLAALMFDVELDRGAKIR